MRKKFYTIAKAISPLRPLGSTFIRASPLSGELNKYIDQAASGKKAKSRARSRAQENHRDHECGLSKTPVSIVSDVPAP
jgi:hypothetical protein